MPGSWSCIITFLSICGWHHIPALSLAQASDSSVSIFIPTSKTQTQRASRGPWTTLETGLLSRTDSAGSGWDRHPRKLYLGATCQPLWGEQTQAGTEVQGTCVPCRHWHFHQPLTYSTSHTGLLWTSNYLLTFFFSDSFS